MAEVVLTKTDDGKLDGLTEADQRKWAKFRAQVTAMAPGDTLKATFKLPRSPAFHRRHFAILWALFKCQENFTDADRFREWVEVGAGFCDLLPGPKGKPVAIAKSIAWDALEEADFAEHHRAVLEFVRTTHFTRFIWPSMTDLQGDNMVNAILQEFA